MKSYKIHIKRLKTTKGETTRSIKFLLKPVNQTDAYEKIIENFVNDDHKVRGIANLIDIKSENQYSLLDFWVDTLKCGIVFQSKGKKIRYFIQSIRGKKTMEEIIFDQADEKIKNYFKKVDFIKNIIISDAKRSSSTKKSFFNTLFDILNNEFKNEKEKIIINSDANKLVNFITNSFYDEEGKLILDSEEKQNQFWKNNFNIDKNLLNGKTNNELGELTSFILPELIRLNGDIKLEELINLRFDLVKKYLKINSIEPNEKIINEQTASLLGLSDNFNAFSNYFNNFFNVLLEGNIEVIINYYKTIIDLSNQEEEKIKESLIYLAEKSRLLGKPKFISYSWQEYRSVFGGKLESWFSNYLNRLTKSQENYNKIKGEISKIIAYFDRLQILDKKFSEDNDFQKSKLKIKNQLVNLKNLLEQNPDLLNIPGKYSIFSDYLAEIKTDLNFFYQKYLKISEDDMINNDKNFKFLYEKFEKPINFYGQSKKESLLKIIEKSKLKVIDGFKIIRILLDESKSLKDNDFKKTLSEILNVFFEKLSKKILSNQSIFFNDYKKIIDYYISEENNKKEIYNQPQKYAFYISKFSNNNSLKIIKIKNFDNQDSQITNLIRSLYSFLKNINHNLLLKDVQSAIEYLEITKSFLSFVIENNKKNEFIVDKNLFSNFEGVLNFINLHKSNCLINQEFNRLLNQYFFADLKGTLNILSKKYDLAKYTLQILKSDERFPILINFKDIKVSLKQLLTESKKIINYSHRYLIVIGDKINDYFEFKKLNQEDQTDYFIITKQGIRPILITNLNKNHVFQIHSSRHQLQFLDRLIYKPYYWQNISISISEPSFILEIKHQIDLEKFVFKKESQNLYLSLPFQINSEEPQKKLNEKIYLGIDAGEYGVAYCLTDFTEDIPKIIESSYIKNKNVRKIRDKFEIIKQRARGGVFIQSENVVRKVRENAINEIRNQIHKVFLKYKVPIIYEYSISNFETGSGRITKIYNSIKKSDVDSKANKPIIKHIWGSNSINIGLNLSAYASSYTCSVCGRSIFEVVNDFDTSQATVVSRLKTDGLKNVIEIKTTHGNLYGYTQNKKFIENYRFQNTKQEKEEFLKIIKNFARPPLEKSEVLLTLKKLDPLKLKEIKKQRGNCAVFICPFVDCGKIFDADLQAAFNMSVRGYVKNNLKNNQEVNIFEETIRYLKNHKPINYKMLEIV